VKRSEKEVYVAQLRESLDDKEIVVVARQGGLAVSDITSLRVKMRQGGGAVKVLKNKLAKRAFAGSKFETISEHFTGPVIIGSSSDTIAAAKVFVDFAEENEKLEVIAGNLDGKTLTKQNVESLAKLPSMDELRGKIVGVLVAPASRIARVLQAPGTQVARVLGAHVEKSKN